LPFVGPGVRTVRGSSRFRDERSFMSKTRGAEDERYRERERREKDYRAQVPGADEEPLPTPVEPIHSDAKPKRNDPCPCGSGKKYKQCCGKAS